VLKQHVIACLGISSLLVFGFLSVSLLESTEALEWKWTKYEKWNCCTNSNVQPLNLSWKWTKYEKWNCCTNANFKPFPNPESINSNEIIQNIEVNQACEHVQVCLIDVHDLNSQVNYGDR
jgi:hypothetical protein